MITHLPLRTESILLGLSLSMPLLALVAVLTRKGRRMAKARAKAKAIKPPQTAEQKCAEEKTVKAGPSAIAAHVDKGVLLPGVEITEFYLHDIENLNAHFEPSGIPNDSRWHLDTSTGERISYNQHIGNTDFIIEELIRRPNSKPKSECFVRAGPRATLHFTPGHVNAAIVTCGGLCPGLNNVIRELVHSLTYLYSVKNVWGVRGGYSGFEDEVLPPILLDCKMVSDIHHQGGTLLCSSRGGFHLDKIIDFLVEKDIQLLFIIGGDGTHRGAHIISQEVIRKQMNVAVAGIPKTIDNDVDLIDRSFGFQTSVEAAQQAIQSAKVEARCNLPNGIGVVKLMGRSAGFIALHAALASGDVDLCLIPEVPIVLEGPNGCLPHLMQRVKEQGHAVVVVAEGAGEELLGSSTACDASGNKKLPPIGEWLRDRISEYFKSQGAPATVKYIDPSYMIRSVPANSADSLYCMLLGQNAVHGVMAGFTGFSVGLVNNRLVYIPIPRLVQTSPRVVNPNGRTWERLISTTRQPNTARPFDPTVSSSARTII